VEVTQIRENPDGSADFSFELTALEKEALIRFAIMEAIKNGIKEGMKYAVCEDSVEDAGGGEADSVHGSGVEPSESGK
jgi:hypothetical protein